eukprot:TRINITY_DN128_c1_g1_i3.p1 TRINITY_DN128_c1_g1~~TRINITY_DN128_c1_g1_i3.p1  ORF type:complete len:1239 (+),score=366.90 TRINITY_DN128_c1_g1_i3:14-3730(+)
MSVLEQLRKRQETSESKGIKRVSNVVHSLLFDGKEAARIPAETIRMLALEGLEELSLLDSRIKKFGAILFNEHQTARHLLTKEANNTIDEQIASFLPLLSPHFLLGGTHKVLEHLIRRFQINLYNVNDLMRCVLPYHETNIFVRILLLVDLNNSEWKFLAPCSKAGVGPSRSLIGREMLNSQFMLEFICSIPAKAVKAKTAYKSLFSFYVATLVNFFSLYSLPLSGGAGESALRVIYPFLIAGAKSDNEEFKLSTYALISSLAVAIKLDKEFIISLSTNVVVSSLNHTHQQSLVTLLVLLQSLEPQDRALSPSTVETLMSWKNLFSILTSISKTEEFGADLTAFYGPYLFFLAGRFASDESYVKHALLLLDSVPNQHLSAHASKYAYEIINKYLTAYGSMSPDLQESIRLLIKKLDLAFPKELDITIDVILREYKESEKKGEKKKSLSSSVSWNTLFEGTRHQLLVDPSAKSSDAYSLSVALSDGLSQTFTHALSPSSPPSLTIRALNLVKSMPFYASTEKNASDPTLPILNTAILSLLDINTHPSVFTALFSLDLHKFSEPEQLFAKITGLLKKLAANGNAELYILTITFFAGEFATKFAQYSDDILGVLLECIISNQKTSEWCSGPEQLKGVITALSKFDHPILKGFKVPTEETKAGVVEALVTCMGGSLATDCDKFHVLIPTITEKTPVLSGLFYLVQNHALVISKSQVDKFKIAFLLLSQISRNIVSPVSSGQSTSEGGPSPLSKVAGLPQYSLALFSGMLSGKLSTTPLQLHTVNNILSLLETASSSLSYTSDDRSGAALFAQFPTITASSYSFSVLCRLLFLVSSNVAFRDEFHHILPRLFSVVGTSSLVHFLSYFWASPPNSEIKFSCETQVLCLRIFQAMLTSSGKTHKHVPTSNYLSLLLVPLTCPHLEVRKAGFDCLQQIHDIHRSQGKTAVLSVDPATNEMLVSGFDRLLSDMLESKATVLAQEQNLAFFFQNFFFFTKGQAPLSLSILSVLHESIVKTALSFPHPYPRYVLLKALEKIEDRERVGWTLPFVKAKLEQGKKGGLEYYDCLTLDLLLREYKDISVPVIDKNEETFTFYTSLISSLYLYKVVNNADKQGEEEEEEEEEEDEEEEEKVNPFEGVFTGILAPGISDTIFLAVKGTLVALIVIVILMLLFTPWSEVIYVYIFLALAIGLLLSIMWFEWALESIKLEEQQKKNKREQQHTKTKKNKNAKGKKKSSKKNKPKRK